MSLPIIGHQVRIASRNVHYLRVGNGRTTVVLLHGFASLAQEIAAPFLPQDGVTFLAFDRPGYGLSDRLDLNGPASQARWLAEILDALGERNCIVVAHSLGSSIALWMAARRPDLVSRLLLLAPFCRPTRKLGAAFLHAALQPGIGPVLADHLFPIVAAFTGPSFLKSALSPNPIPKHLERFPFAYAGRPGALRTMALEYRNFQHDMAEFDRSQPLRSRISVIFGSLDRVARPEWHLDWLSGLKAAVDIDVLPGVGHAPHHAKPCVVQHAVQALI